MFLVGDPDTDTDPDSVPNPGFNYQKMKNENVELFNIFGSILGPP
jgi:hypothetical protein